MSNPTKDGGPAFPVPSVCNANGAIQWGTDGMTLRDWFAGQALAASDWSEWDTRTEPNTKIAARSYALADAMLAERVKGPTQ